MVTCEVDETDVNRDVGVESESDVADDVPEALGSVIFVKDRGDPTDAPGTLGRVGTVSSLEWIAPDCCRDCAGTTSGTTTDAFLSIADVPTRGDIAESAILNFTLRPDNYR
ncbi:MAG: hypothetical protein V4695_04690 [Pseudomonadota bacterium]